MCTGIKRISLPDDIAEEFYRRLEDKAWGRFYCPCCDLPATLQDEIVISGVGGHVRACAACESRFFFWESDSRKFGDILAKVQIADFSD